MTPLRWGLVFLQCPLPIEDEQKMALIRLAATAYFEDLPEVEFNWPAFKGSVRATSDTVALGSFVGQRFEADVHFPDGQATLKFLVTEAQLQMAWNQPVAEA